MKCEESIPEKERAGDLIAVEEQISLLNSCVLEVIDDIKRVLLTIEEGTECSTEEESKNVTERAKGDNRIREAALRIAAITATLNNIRATKLKEIKKIVE